MSDNYRRNKIEVAKYREKLKFMLSDISDIDVKVLNKAVNEGAKEAKEHTNVVTGFMRRSWHSTRTVKSAKGVTKTLYNSAEYAPYVNYGHRITNRSGETIGWVKGQFMLEKSVHKVDKAMLKEFKKEVEKVRKKHDK